MSARLKYKTLRVTTLHGEVLTLPMSMVRTLVQEPGSSNTTLVVTLPGKEAEKLVGHWIHNPPVPKLPPPPNK